MNKQKDGGAARQVFKSSVYMETTSLATLHPIGRFCPNGEGEETRTSGSESVNDKQTWIVYISGFQHHLQITRVSGDRQQQQVSIWIKPSEAEGAGGLAVLRYAAFLINKCLNNDKAL